MFALREGHFRASVFRDVAEDRDHAAVSIDFGIAPGHGYLDDAPVAPHDGRVVLDVFAIAIKQREHRPQIGGICKRYDLIDAVAQPLVTRPAGERRQGVVEIYDHAILSARDQQRITGRGEQRGEARFATRERGFRTNSLRHFSCTHDDAAALGAPLDAVDACLQVGVIAVGHGKAQRSVGPCNGRFPDPRRGQEGRERFAIVDVEEFDGGSAHERIQVDAEEAEESGVCVAGRVLLVGHKGKQIRVLKNRFEATAHHGLPASARPLGQDG